MFNRSRMGASVNPADAMGMAFLSLIYSLSSNHQLGCLIALLSSLHDIVKII